jgi:hypothetical protein
VPVEDHLGVAAEHDLALDGARLAARVLDDDVTRVAVRQLVDLGRRRRELDPELVEDRAPLRRGRRED